MYNTDAYSKQKVYIIKYVDALSKNVGHKVLREICKKSMFLTDRITAFIPFD